MSEAPEAAPAAPPKVDPETLVLRGSPRRVVRFRRGAIIAIAIAALGSAVLVGVTWMALKPVTFRAVISGEDRDYGSKAPPDALANAPKSYGDVPKLGPPLPGDLGRPILAHQQAIAAVPQAPAVDAAAQAAEAERQRLEAERKAARQSGVMMQVPSSQRQDEASAAVAQPVPASSDAASGKVALDPERDPNGQQRKADFFSAIFG